MKYFVSFGALCHTTNFDFYTYLVFNYGILPLNKRSVFASDLLTTFFTIYVLYTILTTYLAPLWMSTEQATKPLLFSFWTKFRSILETSVILSFWGRIEVIESADFLCQQEFPIRFCNRIANKVTKLVLSGLTKLVFLDPYGNIMDLGLILLMHQNPNE